MFYMYLLLIPISLHDYVRRLMRTKIDTNKVGDEIYTGWSKKRNPPPGPRRKILQENWV